MEFAAQGRLLRMLRIRRGWRQTDVATRCGLSSSVIGRHENGEVQSLAALERHAGVFGVRVRLTLTGRGGELVRLRDEEHAAIVEAMAAWLRSLEYTLDAEVSFNEWGERGRVDLLAFDARNGTLAIVEAKTELTDMQDLFGALDVKRRLASRIAARRGWTVRRVVVVLAVAASPVNRRIVQEHRTLFAAFPVRRLSRGALQSGERMLTWIHADAAQRPAWAAARRRIRTRAGEG
jgi:transcriptional regulator with XRE-family HTH domain